MEPQKRARYSIFLDAEELEEIMMEELNKFNESTENISPPPSSSSSSNEAEEREIRFRDRRPEDLPKVLDFTGPAHIWALWINLTGW
jgi:hypothetical protein